MPITGDLATAQVMPRCAVRRRRVRPGPEQRGSLSADGRDPLHRRRGGPSLIRGTSGRPAGHDLWFCSVIEPQHPTDVDAAVTATAGPAPGSGEAFELHAGHRHPDIPGLTVVRLAAGLDLLRRPRMSYAGSGWRSSRVRVSLRRPASRPSDRPAVAHAPFPAREAAMAHSPPPQTSQVDHPAPGMLRLTPGPSAPERVRIRIPLGIRPVSAEPRGVQAFDDGPPGGGPVAP
jgi:hypothetical protein